MSTLFWISRVRPSGPVINKTTNVGNLSKVLYLLSNHSCVLRVSYRTLGFISLPFWIVFVYCCLLRFKFCKLLRLNKTLRPTKWRTDVKLCKSAQPRRAFTKVLILTRHWVQSDHMDHIGKSDSYFLHLKMKSKQKCFKLVHFDTDLFFFSRCLCFANALQRKLQLNNVELNDNYYSPTCLCWHALLPAPLTHEPANQHQNITYRKISGRHFSSFNPF